MTKYVLKNLSSGLERHVSALEDSTLCLGEIVNIDGVRHEVISITKENAGETV